MVGGLGSCLFLLAVAAAGAVDCEAHAAGIAIGSVTCQTTDEAAENYGFTCVKSQLGDLIAQGCDSGACAEVGNPQTCCTMPITEQKVICGDGMTGAPQASDFNSCSSTCGIDASASGAPSMSTSPLPIIAITMGLFKLFI